MWGWCVNDIVSLTKVTKACYKYKRKQKHVLNEHAQSMSWQNSSAVQLHDERIMLVPILEVC